MGLKLELELGSWGRFKQTEAAQYPLRAQLLIRSDGSPLLLSE